jgi:hypothetical protein
MERHWQDKHGFTVPNPLVYPNRWLWDSCFHSIIWATLGDRRCEQELVTLFRSVRGTGFLPHIWYPERDEVAERLWGVGSCSTLTQPPMFGHAIAVMAEAGWDVSSLVRRATRAIWWLLRARRAPSGLVFILHPWESGFDDHPRWDRWFVGGREAQRRWRIKGRLVAQLELDAFGAAVGGDAFSVCSASFNAMVAWNARDLARVTGDSRLESAANGLALTLDRFWDPSRGNWIDSSTTGAAGSKVRALDSLLGALVTPDQLKARTALEAVVDPSSFATAFGPSGVAVSEPTFDPAGYGRGGTWPQVIYLLWRAAQQRGFTDLAEYLAEALVRGVLASGFAEYWDAQTGHGEGAIPQSWSGLAIVPNF